MNDRLTPGWRAYDALGEEFVRWAYSGTWNRLYDQPTVLELLPPVTGKTVLDVGCGPGAYFEPLLEGGADVIGIDGSREMLTHARERHGERVRLHLVDLDLPLDFLAPGSIDVGICALVLHHLRQPLQLLQELRRALRSDGVLVVSTHHPFFDWATHGGSYFDRTVETAVWAGLHVQYWRATLTDLAKLFRMAGFVIDDLTEHRAPPSVRDVDPELYARLQEGPGFIAFRLVRRD